MTRKIRSMVSGHNNHHRSSGDVQHRKAISVGRPALGSWVSYGLGTANQNLPAYIVLRDERALYHQWHFAFGKTGWMLSQLLEVRRLRRKRTPSAQSKIQRDSSRRSGSSEPSELLAGLTEAACGPGIRRKVI